MTDEQAKALGYLVQRYSTNGPVTITVGADAFDLPDGYITFRLSTRDTSDMYGGISPEGRVST